MTRSDRDPLFLMCPPEHFGVSYAINPWMEPERWAQREHELAALAVKEWRRFYHTLRALGARIELIAPVAGLPDLVFTANAAVVLNRVALLSRFRHGERAKEEPHVEAAFAKLRGAGQIDAVVKLPRGIVLEGAGDCVFDASRKLFFLGYGPRSDAAAASVVADTFGIEVVPLRLIDPRFYHIDTALCALPNGEVAYVPAAFDASGQAALRERVAAAQRIEISGEDARTLAANAVAFGNCVVLSRCSEQLCNAFAGRGYRVIQSALSTFLRSGGAAFCLTLRLDHEDHRAGARLATAAA